jgi:hypothetical protein
MYESHKPDRAVNAAANGVVIHQKLTTVVKQYLFVVCSERKTIKPFGDDRKDHL